MEKTRNLPSLIGYNNSEKYMNKTKTKNLKESEFIIHIENNPVVSTALCEKYGISTETMPMLYMFIVIAFLLKTTTFWMIFTMI